MFAQGAQGAHFGAFPTAYNLLLDSFWSPGHKRSVAVTNISQFSIFFLSRRKDPINLIVKIFEKQQKTFFWSSTGRFISLFSGVYDPNKWMGSPQNFEWRKAAFVGQTIGKAFSGQKFLVSKKFSDKLLCRSNLLCDWFKIMGKKLAHKDFAPVRLISCTQKQYPQRIKPKYVG